MKQKHGLILINAYSNLPHALDQAQRIKEELQALGSQADVRRNNFFPAIVNDGGTIVRAVNDYDFCVYLDKDKYVSQMLEKTGLRLFNPHAAVQACDDKMTTSILLAGYMPMPKTIPAPLCYDPQEPVSEEFVSRIEAELGYPVVVKTSYGSLGKGVFKAENREELVSLCEKLKCVPHLYQRFVRESDGKDMRVIVIGGTTVAAMVRQSDHDFRSNIELGGKGTAITPPREVQRMCETAARVLGLDFCGVDVLFDKDGYSICEVNSNAFFGGMERVTGVNVAKRYAE
ncbi:MAG: RimK family alpha-L-glutamate ligase, partial [Clostridiales bacterium]|nr:RimK family alpha-L-glutamate ligase [Clostridiales bacterium]